MTKTTLLPAIALLARASVAFAEVITVDDDGPVNFVTIQAAVDFTSDAAEIVVAPGDCFLGQGPVPNHEKIIGRSLR